MDCKTTSTKKPRRAAGWTLVEFVVASGLGMLLLAVVCWAVIVTPLRTAPPLSASCPPTSVGPSCTTPTASCSGRGAAGEAATDSTVSAACSTISRGCVAGEGGGGAGAPVAAAGGGTVSLMAPLAATEAAAAVASSTTPLAIAASGDASAAGASAAAVPGSANPRVSSALRSPTPTSCQARCLRQGDPPSGTNKMTGAALTECPLANTKYLDEYTPCNW